MSIIGLSGLAGSGKDTAGKFIVNKYSFTQVALADPMKRFCMEVYGFDENQLWGESEQRNMPDGRFPKPGRQAAYARRLWDNGNCIRAREKGEWHPANELDLKQLEADGWLTPRELLQKVAGDWGRSCYEDTWINYGLNVANKLLAGKHSYNKLVGLIPSAISAPAGVVISDCRYINEIDRIKKAGGKMIRILGGTGLKGDYAKHLSESEQKGISNDVFDVVIVNNETIEDLERKIEHAFISLYGQ